MRYATETSATQFLFSFTFRWITFLNSFFRTPKKKTLDYSLWFLQNFDETMTRAGYFLGGCGGRGGLAVIIYFSKYMYNTPPSLLLRPFSCSFYSSLEGVMDLKFVRHSAPLGMPFPDIIRKKQFFGVGVD